MSNAASMLESSVRADAVLATIPENRAAQSSCKTGRHNPAADRSSLVYPPAPLRGAKLARAGRTTPRHIPDCSAVAHRVTGLTRPIEVPRPWLSTSQRPTAGRALLDVGRTPSDIGDAEWERCSAGSWWTAKRDFGSGVTCWERRADRRVAPSGVSHPSSVHGHPRQRRQ